jgi:rhodanese-related sulfurtransferase
MAGDRIKQIDPQQAYDLLQEDARAVVLDVRSTVEFTHVGHPTGAVHVVWKEGPGWETNPNFVDEVRTRLDGRAEPPEQTPILAICRSGQRSNAAAEALAAAGFTELYNIVEGFEGDRDREGHRSTINGWRYRGLPWEQS